MKFQRRTGRSQTIARDSPVRERTEPFGCVFGGSGIRNVSRSDDVTARPASTRKRPRTPTYSIRPAPSGGPMLAAIGMAAWTMAMAVPTCLRGVIWACVAITTAPLP